MVQQLPGASRLNDFKNLTLIGKGSFGRVFRAVRISDEAEYALKELDMRPMRKREREDCVNEVRILASSVNNPSVIRYYDAFVEGNSLWIVTELARGGDLSAKIKRHVKRSEPLNEDLIWSFFIQVCQGLKCLHQANILHRDIKAANIFITSARGVKIGDLGVAKFTQTGMAQTQIGTPYYMSPELWRNQRYGPHSDVWALGVLLYEMAALKHPFQGNSERQLADKVLRGSFPPIPQKYSEDLATLIKWLLSQDPRKRPTMGEILSHPTVRQRSSASGGESPAGFNTDDIFRTIEVPRVLLQLNARLPGPNYDEKENKDGFHRVNSCPANKALTERGPAQQLSNKEKELGAGYRGAIRTKSADTERQRGKVLKLKTPTENPCMLPSIPSAVVRGARKRGGGEQTPRLPTRLSNYSRV